MQEEEALNAQAERLDARLQRWLKRAKVGDGLELELERELQLEERWDFSCIMGRIYRPKYEYLGWRFLIPNKRVLVYFKEAGGGEASTRRRRTRARVRDIGPDEGLFPLTQLINGQGNLADCNILLIGTGRNEYTFHLPGEPDVKLKTRDEWVLKLKVADHVKAYEQSGWHSLEPLEEPFTEPSFWLDAWGYDEGGNFVQWDGEIPADTLVEVQAGAGDLEPWNPGSWRRRCPIVGASGASTKLVSETV